MFIVLSGIFNMKSNFLSLLCTKNSECIRKKRFRGRNTIFVPDFFVIISWITISLPTIPLNLTLICFLVTEREWCLIAVLIVCSCLHSFCELFINTTALDKQSFSSRKVVLFIIYFFGYGLITTCTKILIMNYKIWKSLQLDSEIFPFPIFYVPNENYSILKMFCFNYVVFKCIPQIFISCIILVGKMITGYAWFLLPGFIFINIIIFSQTIASLFPIRRTPAYYQTTDCIILNAVNKYLATLCACCIQVELFTLAFREIGYFAILAYIVLSLVWLFPCWQMLETQPTPLSRFEFFIYFISFSLVFSFIYIHPFEKQGLVYYYLFYLINLLSEIYFMYSWCNPSKYEVTYYFCLKILFFGFLSCFGMINMSLRCEPPEEKVYIVEQPAEDVVIEEVIEEET